MENSQNYRVLLFYKYVTIQDPDCFAKKHLKFCKQLGVKGRVLVAKEGINGTVSGTIEQTDEYMNHMHKNPTFSDLEFKIDDSEGHAFTRISVKPREEIVSLKLEKDINPTEVTGNYLEPKEFYEAMQRDDVIVIDARNDYEFDIGHFRNAIKPDVKAFRDLPKWIQKNLAEHKDKKILTYCTGGIRCEKFSGWLVREGFQDVNQLHGGIIKYGKDPEVKGQLWDGSCFVFDDRMAVAINQTEDATIIGVCHHCGNPEDQYVNCKNTTCDRLHISCAECHDKFEGYCSNTCKEEI
jgi:UPF0176 protein